MGSWPACQLWSNATQHSPPDDLVHVATCLEDGIDTIVSPDTGFDQVPEIERVAPDDGTRLEALLR